MPRPDATSATASPRRSGAASGRSCRCRRGARQGRAVAIDAEVRLAGRRACAGAARADRHRGAAATARRSRRRPGSIAVCMATFEPDPALFARRSASLRDQTDASWICVISDDCSAPEHVRSGSQRAWPATRASPSCAVERRLGFYRNFERAIALAPPEAELLALCDQDDVWFPGKLAELRGALGDAGLVYSDQRLVDADGRVLRDTLWRGAAQQPHRPRLAPGGEQRDRRRDALPPRDRPPRAAVPRHAGAAVPRSLARPRRARRRRRRLRRPAALRLRPARGSHLRRGLAAAPGRAGRAASCGAARGAYFLGYAPRVVQAEALLARCARELTPAKRRALRRFRAAESLTGRVRVARAAAAARAGRPRRDARQRVRAGARDRLAMARGRAGSRSRAGADAARATHASRTR